MAPLTAAAIGIVGIIAGHTSAMFEALVVRARINRGDRRNLPHLWLQVVRAAILMPICLLCSKGWNEALLYLVSTCAATFAPTHRAAFNLWRTLLRVGAFKWYYLGPSLRGRRESWYDTIFWHLASPRVETVRTHLRFYPIRPWLPFALASAFELLVLLWSLWLFGHLPSPETTAP